MSKNKKNFKRKQSNLSKVLASSNKKSIIHRLFFKNLSADEIRRSVPKLFSHRHFKKALNPNKNGASDIYIRHTPDLPLDKCVSWCLGLLECHATELQRFLDKQEVLLSLILQEQYDEALEIIQNIEADLGISTWGVSLQGTLLSIIDPDQRRKLVAKIISDANDNDFFKALTYHLTNKFDDLETLHSESKFFELKIRRTFAGHRLHFLMYKLVPYNMEFGYDFEGILGFEKNSSPIDIFQTLIDFLIFNVHSDNQKLRSICVRTLTDLRSQFEYNFLNDIAVAYGLEQPTMITTEAIAAFDLYTSGDYEKLCILMEQNKNLQEQFGLVEIWAKSLARIDGRVPNSLSHILIPLRDVVVKSSNYGKSKANLLAYCHAFEMFGWFRELRYLQERETKFYDSKTSEIIRQTSLLLSSITTPAKAEVLAQKNFISSEDISKIVPSDSVTARLFDRVRSIGDEEPTDQELMGIEKNRQIKFKVLWNLSRKKFDRSISLLKEQLVSEDIRVVHDASRSLVEAYRALGEVEEAANIYVNALLDNIHLLSAFDSVGLINDCMGAISSSKSIYIPLVFSIHSRFIGEDFDAALKYSFECYLRNNGYSNPLEFAKSEGFPSSSAIYFLRYVCTPEVMKLYLYFETPIEIEQCRIEICKVLLGYLEGDEELVFEVVDRTRRLFLREAANQVQSSRIFSDANLLAGTSSNAFKALYERFITLRLQDFSAWDDEIQLNKFLSVLKGEELLIQNAHNIHIQDLVINEKNSVFLKLVKLVRDEFAFGEKGLNVYLSTRIRHGHFPNTIRKPLLDNFLLASKATDTASYKLNKNWLSAFRLDDSVVESLEQFIIEFSVKFNELVDEVNDNWLRIFTIDQDISGLSKDGEYKKSLFNYSVTVVETHYLQGELSPKASYTDFIAVATKWLWTRTEMNLSVIRERLSEDMSVKALSLLEELGKNAITKCGIEKLGDFPDSLARARNGLVQAFDGVQGWFTRARGATIQAFELDIAVQIASTAADVEIRLDDKSDIIWDGILLNPMVDAFYILFENALSKSELAKNELEVVVEASVSDNYFVIRVENYCKAVEDLAADHARLDRYRAPESFLSVMDAAQGEGGSGFFKLWHLLEKDMRFTHKIDFGRVKPNLFQVEIKIPMAECRRVQRNEDIVDRR